MLEDKLRELIKDWDPSVQRVVLRVATLERAYLSKVRFDHKEQVLKIIDEEVKNYEAGQARSEEL